MSKLIPTTIFALALVLGFAGPSAATHVGPGFINGAVFVATNSFDQTDEHPRGNEIVMYRMVGDGSLVLRGRFPTGGQGSGPGTSHRANALGSANSVVLSQNQKWLFAVNAGDNTLSFFHVSPEGLTLIGRVPSGGSFPNSVAVQRDLLYVLNAGGDGNITGFRIIGGHLVRLSGSTRGLKAGGIAGEVPDAFASPAQVSFSPDGRFLVVTIKDGGDPPLPSVARTGPGRILVFQIDSNGLPSREPVETPSSGAGPFGFTFDRDGTLFVAESRGGPSDTGAVSSYRINRDASLDPISASIGNDQLDSCWIVVGADGRFLYTANFGSDTISRYAIGADGSVFLQEAIAAETAAPDSFNIDLGRDGLGDFLYNLLPGVGKVAAWGVRGNGTLSDLGEFNALEASPELDPSEPFGPGGSAAGLAVASF